MTEIRQTQKSGAGAVATQIGQQIIVGVDEKRVREICDEKLAYAIKDLTKEAHDVACGRVSEFISQVVTKINERKLDVSVFSEPKFQREITKAQSSAASSDREGDIELLSELLVARMNGSLKRKTHTGISRAIEIVSDVDDDELTALTVVYAFFNFRPIPMVGLSLAKGLTALNNVFSQMNIQTLPKGEGWMENLNMLDAIILSPFGKFRNVEEYCAEVMDGYVCVGIEEGSPEFLAAQQKLSNVGLPLEILVRNELMDGHVRVPLVKQVECAEVPLFRSGQDMVNNRILNTQIKPTDAQVSALKEVLALYKKDQRSMKQVRKAFVNEWQNYPSLVAVGEWIDRLKKSFEITKVGMALAYTNAKRCVPGLPTLVLE